MDLQKDDMIDFNKLESELADAIAKDEKYQRENDAKFRAIRQKVANYDEFRDIVLASHLKPLDKQDKSGGMRYQSWNRMGINSDKTVNADCDHIPSTSWLIPKTSSEFDKSWKRICKSSSDKFEFLVAIGPEGLKNIFITDSPLGEIVECISEEANYPDHLSIILGLLEIISLSKRFSLNLSFLDSEEIKKLKDIFSNCEKSLQISDNEVELLKLFQHLKEKYQVALSS